MRFGYCRVSSICQKDGNSLEAQEIAVRSAGAEKIFTDIYTGTKLSRPNFDRLLEEITTGDELIITKLDRVARSAVQGIELIQTLIDKGVRVHVLNMGVLDDTATGRLIRNIMLCFADFERAMIIERTGEGRQIARQNPAYKEGRPLKYTRVQMEHAIRLLEQYSYTQVERLTGISKATLVRHRKDY